RQAWALQALGWAVLRFWETDILRRTGEIVDRVVAVLNRRDAFAQHTGQARRVTIPETDTIQRVVIETPRRSGSRRDVKKSSALPLRGHRTTARRSRCSRANRET